MATPAELGLVFQFPPSLTPDTRYRIVVGINEAVKPPELTIATCTYPDGSQPFDPTQARLSFMVGNGHPLSDIGSTFGTITQTQAEEALQRYIDTDEPNLKPFADDIKRAFASEWGLRR